MALERPYCSVQDVQLETKSSENELTSLYEASINRASRYIDAHCKRDFWFHDHTESPFIVPRNLVLGSHVALPYPILTISEVRYTTDASEASSAEQAVDAADYYFEVGKCSLHISSAVDYPFFGRVEVYGELGYAVTLDTEVPVGLPSSVRRACTLLAAAWSNERRVEQVALDGSRTSLIDSSVPKEVPVLLDRYVLRVGSNF